MTRESSPASASLPVEALERINSVCDRFEQAWQSDEGPRIEDHLGEVPHTYRGALLRELLTIALQYRRKGDPALSPEDYRDRFPELAADLAEMLAGIPLASGSSRDRPSTTSEASPSHTIVDDEPPSLPGFRLSEERLGKGGMGVVWMGQDEKLHRPVAVKVMQRKLLGEPKLLQRFLREARITSQLQHPAVPPVYAVGELSDGRPYFCMKVVKGHTLARLLDGWTGATGNHTRFLAIFHQRIERRLNSVSLAV